jgi:RNA polymerase sigma-B factor
MSRPTERIRMLAKEYRDTGDRAARNEIIELHLDIADVLARKASTPAAPFEDLRQTALLAMVRAVDRFDPDLGIEFSTFAARTIEGELKRYMRDRTWSVRPPRSALELHLAVRTTIDSLTHDLGRSPTVPEIAEAVGSDVDHVLEALEVSASRSTKSLDSPVPGTDDLVLGDTILAGEDLGFDRVEVVTILRDVLQDLDERDRKIIEMRFFDELTQEEIAAKLGISQSYLSRILRRVLDRLRDRIERAAP